MRKSFPQEGSSWRANLRQGGTPEKGKLHQPSIRLIGARGSMTLHEGYKFFLRLRRQIDLLGNRHATAAMLHGKLCHALGGVQNGSPRSLIRTLLHGMVQLHFQRFRHRFPQRVV